MAALITIEVNSENDGFGAASQVGRFFLRRVKIDGNASVTTRVLTVADVGAGTQKIIGVLSIVPLANDTVYQSAIDAAGASVTFTWTTNTTAFYAYVLCQGM